MKGFFEVNEPAVKRKPLSLLPACGACGLFKSCKSPKMKVYGQGRRKIMLLGESPGSTEDDEGRPFCGQAGKVIRDALRRHGVDMDRDCWIANALRCKGPKNPKSELIDHCRPFTVNDVTELNPEVIIPMGGAAVKSLLGWLWKDDVGMISRWDGWTIPCQQLNAWICSTWHPAALLHQNAYGRDDEGNAVRKLLFERHVEAACRLEGRPWREVPDWKSKVKVVYDAGEAAQLITGMTGDRPVAFDIETTTLKPDGPDAEIYSAAMSDGKVTISYPWMGAAVEATKEFLVSDTPKIGFNVKFENRYCKAKLGVWIRNWAWDGMIAAHVLDNRPDICGLAFQEFVLLGHVHKDEMAKYLKADGGSNARNRIKEAPLDRLLLYGGLDALVEWKVAKIQAKQMGVDLLR